jgi:hypothetical protein
LNLAFPVVEFGEGAIDVREQYAPVGVKPETAADAVEELRAATFLEP